MVVSAPAALSAAVSSSVFVLMCLVLLCLCVREICQIPRQLSTFFFIFLIFFHCRLSRNRLMGARIAHKAGEIKYFREKNGGVGECDGWDGMGRMGRILASFVR